MNTRLRNQLLAGAVLAVFAGSFAMTAHAAWDPVPGDDNHEFTGALPAYDQEMDVWVSTPGDDDHEFTGELPPHDPEADVWIRTPGDDNYRGYEL